MLVSEKNIREIYSRNHLSSPYLEGYDEFKKGKLGTVKSRQLEMLSLKQDTNHLEIGYGSGDLLYHCAKRDARVAGIDFSPDAFEIVKESVKPSP